MRCEKVVPICGDDYDGDDDDNDDNNNNNNHHLYSTEFRRVIKSAFN